MQLVLALVATVAPRSRKAIEGLQDESERPQQKLYWLQLSFVCCYLAREGGDNHAIANSHLRRLSAFITWLTGNSRPNPNLFKSWLPH